MRHSCIECVAKHVGSALVLLSETLHGYQDHLILAIGELERAVQECEAEYPKLSEDIRDVRKLVTSRIPELLMESNLENRTARTLEIATRLYKLRASIMEMLLLAASEERSVAPTDGV